MATRRDFIGLAASALPGLALMPGPRGAHDEANAGRSEPRRPMADRHAGFDPWIEVDPISLRHNVRVLHRLAGGRPVMAVIKNNGYGLGLSTVAPILESMEEIEGFAVVKAAAAHELRDLNVQKPLLLMGLFEPEDAPDLVRRGIDLSLYTDDSLSRLEGVGDRAPVHLYVDTGMSRMGMPYHRAPEWIARVSRNARVSVRSTYMGFTEDDEFDREQLQRFLRMAEEARGLGGDTGRLHAASSDAVFNFEAAHLDLVRPGIALYGAYPSNSGVERSIAELRPALRLKARVVRVERLRAGDSVSYGRAWTAERPTWVATLPVGHADGYPRGAVQGAQVLLNGRLVPPVGAVSASHTIVAIGDEKTAEVGDVATLIGPDDPAITPNGLATRAGVSVYDVLMHLNPLIPKVVV